MRVLHRTGVCALALIAGATALQFEPAILRDIGFARGSDSVTVGAVRTSLWNAALAQTADSFSLENITIKLGETTYDAKRIDFAGVTSSRAEIEALLSSSEPMANRLARINARQITVPELRVKRFPRANGSDESRRARTMQEAVYKGVVLNGISEGKIESAVIEGMEGQATGTGNDGLVKAGRSTLEGMNLQALAELYEKKDETGSAPLARIYGNFTVENISFADKKEGVEFVIARMNGRDFMARPTKNSWSGTDDLLNELAGKKDLTPEENARVMATVADMLGAFDIGFVEMTGMTMKAPTGSEGKKRDKAKPVNFRINRIAYTGTVGGQPADARLEGLDVSDGKGGVKMESMSVTGFSIAPTLNGLRTLAGKSPDDIDAATIRSLIPTLGTFRMTGLDIDAMSQDEDGRKQEPVKAKLKSFELTADKPINAIPTHVNIGLQNLAMDLPSKSTDDGIKELVALGYKAINLSLAAAADWNEATSEIVLKDVSVQGENMGTVQVKGVIGGVSKDVFNPDSAVALVALIGSKAKSVDVVVENKGLFERYLEKTAREEKTKPESLRRNYASAAAILLPALIGNSDQAKALSQAVARFIAQPGKLTVNALPKDSSGIGVADFMVLSDPKDIMQKLNLTAKAE